MRASVFSHIRRLPEATNVRDLLFRNINQLLSTLYKGPSRLFCFSACLQPVPNRLFFEQLSIFIVLVLNIRLLC